LTKAETIMPQSARPAAPMKPVWAVGLMTGTALDGMIDVALVRTDGESIAELGHWSLQPYGEAAMALIPEAVAAARDWAFAGLEPAILAQAEAALTQAQSAAVLHVLNEAGLQREDVRIIGFHGQTVLHLAPTLARHGRTRQLGDGARMAQLTGIDVAFDFRSHDMTLGGQGAPLVPAWHVALLRHAGLDAPAAALNLGGVGNITWWGGGDEVVAFDTGPANGPLNDWIVQHGAGDFDRDGLIAARGTVDEARLARLLAHPYFSVKPPKSLDRFDFQASMADGLSLEDGAATLTAFSAAAIGRGLDLLPQRPDRLILCGGGRKNPALVREIATRARVTPIQSESVGWRGDAVEAECFAYLAVRTLRGLPISFPMTTGVAHPSTGGRIALARP
jgi:anhydro-N-acetylmuramic acid kinase